MNFSVFKIAVANQFQKMQQHQLFITNINKSDLWSTYLNSFPQGSNPIFRERTEHDCSCCKQFINAVGHVVAIIDNKINTIWDIEIPNEPEYQIVANAMSKFVKLHTIESAFYYFSNTAGINKNFEEILGDIKTWEHFYVNIDRRYLTNIDLINEKTAKVSEDYKIMFRSLESISLAAIEIALDLIAQNSLHRGEEFTPIIKKFRDLKEGFENSNEKNLFVWQRILNIPASLSHIRNTAIGSFLVNVSEGMNLEDAVVSFGKIMDPLNYKRPTAIFTTKMKEQAEKTVIELGYLSALNRRYANIHDININDILYIDRSIKTALNNNNPFDMLHATDSLKIPKLDRIEEVTITDFITNILPRSKTISIMPQNSHESNFVSLITASDPTSKSMFKWENQFSWAYNGDAADSIKERVKNAGGIVDGDLCCRLSWNNYNDLDLYMVEPNGYQIYFGNKGTRSRNGGLLDVDMNAMVRQTRSPVENIVYKDIHHMQNGKYSLFVNQYHLRENIDVGFDVEIDILGNSQIFSLDRSLRDRETICVAVLEVQNGNIKIIESLESKEVAKNIWNLNTNKWHRISTIMMSPNHWEHSNKIGNKHYFFMIDQCKNPEGSRGFFNEFLKEELNSHRKVFEMLGSRMITDPSDNQLSGLGFSSTNKNSILCKVEGNISRIIKIII